MANVNTNKIIVYSLMGVTVVMLAYVLLFEVFHIGKRNGDYREPSITQTVPAGEALPIQDSKSEAYKDPGRKRSTTVDEYFGSLVVDNGEDISLVSDNPHTPTTPHSPTQPIQPSSDATTRVFGAAPAEDAPPARPVTGSNGSGSRRTMATMTPEERMAYDRQRAEMVRDVVTGSNTQDNGNTPEAPAPAVAPEVESLSFSSSDGIISSLDDDFVDTSIRYADGAKRPFRCMFVRDEKIKNGQRVTVRLLEEYNLEGTRIPANTHLQAICKIQDRLNLSIRSIELNGRLIPLTLDAYDTDGIIGIYCPEASKAVKTVTNDAITTAGTTFGGLVGDLANTVLRTGASIARNANGEVSVSVNQGYEFYLVKSEKR